MTLTVIQDLGVVLARLTTAPLDAAPREFGTRRGDDPSDVVRIAETPFDIDGELAKLDAEGYQPQRPEATAASER